MVLISTITIIVLLKVRNLGKPVDLAGQYYKDGADEVFPNFKIELIISITKYGCYRGFKASYCISG